MQRSLTFVSALLIAACASHPMPDALEIERGFHVSELGNGELGFAYQPIRGTLTDALYRDIAESREYEEALRAINDKMTSSREWVLLRREYYEFELLLAYRSRRGDWRAISVQSTQTFDLDYRPMVPIDALVVEQSIAALSRSDFIYRAPMYYHADAGYVVTTRRGEVTTRSALLFLGGLAASDRLAVRGNPTDADLELIETIRRLRAEILNTGAANSR